MQKNERWIGVGAGSGNPSARLRAARSMPHWMETRGGLPAPPPPPPAPDLEPFPNDPDYEVIDVPGQAYSNTIPTTVEIRVKRCELCGASGPSVQCEQCPQQSFCPSCDEMYHRHPKRQAHVRRAIMDPMRPGEPPRPPLPPKGDSHMAAAPVPPPRRNKKNQLPIGSSSTLKRETGLVGSLRRMITGKTPPPPRPPPVARDRSGSLINNNMDFHRSQMMFGEMETNGWGRGVQGGGRAGSMTGLNMAQGFGPMMHAQSVAHLGCPGCQGWGWGSQAALHQVGVHGAHGMHPPHGGMHGSIHAGMHMPPPQPFWYPSWDPRRHRRSHHSRHTVDSSSDEDEQPSPAMSRRSIRLVDSDSDDSFKKSRPHSRRESLVDLRRRDDDTMSLRGGRYDDDARSLRGHRKDSLRRKEDTERSVRRGRRTDDTVSERGGLRHADDTVSERGGVRRRPDDLLSDDRAIRRKEDDTFSERGGKRVFDRTEVKMKDDDSWDGNSRRSDRNDKKYHQDNSWDKPVDKRRDRYLADSDSDRRNKAIDERKQNKITESLKVKSDTKSRSLGVESQSFTKSSETVSSIMSSTSGEDKARGPKKDKVFSDTGQRRRATLDSNGLQGVVKNIPPEIKDEEIVIEPEEDMKPLGPIPITEWECQHCTYVNRPGSRVCEVCCKTRTLPMEFSELEDTATIETAIAELDVKEEVKEDPKPEEQQKKKEPSPPSPRLPLVEASNGTQTTKNISLTSKGTSPPPQSISTQTYDVAGLNVKKTVSSEVGWSSPRRSFSRQSIVSDTAQSGISPPGSRSPGETDSQMTDVRQQKRSDLSSTLTRKPSRAGSLASEQITNMVQKQVNQGLEMVKLLRDAEEVGFSGEEVSVAVEHCGDSNPLQWLLDNWTHMIDTVVTLATNYGHERKENTIGTVSDREARAALIMHQGSVWSAVTEVVQQRQNKYGELLSRGNFSREDIVTALTAHHGELEAAYTELTKGQLKPFLRRMWAPNNHIVSGEFEDQRADWDTTGRVQTWLTQHVYQSLPKLKQEPSQQSRRHSDVHRFLKEVFAGQSIQSSFGDNNRYASLHSLAGKTGRGQFGGDFGAPPERYTSCLNLHEASTRSDLTGSRLYPKQRPLYPSKPLEDNRIERQISMPDRSPEFRGKFFFDRQESMPDNYMFESLEPSRNSQNIKWKNIEMTNDTPLNIRSDSQTDERSEYLEDSKSEDVQREYEEEEEEETQGIGDQVYNGRLQLLIQRNHKKKRRPKRTIKSYHSKFNIKSDIKHLKSNREETLGKINRVAFVEEEENSLIGGSLYANQIRKAKKDSTEEYESIESSTEEEIQNNEGLTSTRNSILRKSQPKNERIIIIQRESPEEERGTIDINFTEPPVVKTKSLETLSDKESVSQSQSEGMGEQDFKELEASFSNSIPFIDEEEASSSDDSEDEHTKSDTNKSESEEKHPKQTGGSKSDDSSKYISPIEWSESEKHHGVATPSTSGNKQSAMKENESPKNNDPHATTSNMHFDEINNNESSEEEIDSENILEPEIHSSEENLFQNYDDKQETEEEVNQSNESSEEELIEIPAQTNKNEIKMRFMSAEDEKDIDTKMTGKNDSEIAINKEILMMNQNKTTDIQVLSNSKETITTEDMKENKKLIKPAKHNYQQVNDKLNISQKKHMDSVDTDIAVKQKSNDQQSKNKNIVSEIAETKESGHNKEDQSPTDNQLDISNDKETGQGPSENKSNDVQTIKVQIINPKNKVQIDKTQKVHSNNQKNRVEPENQTNELQNNTKNNAQIESQSNSVLSENPLNIVQSVDEKNKGHNDNKKNKDQSITQENKVQNANQTNKIPSNNQTNKVQSTTQENKVQNAKQTNKIPSNNQTNKVQSTTKENKVQNANQTNKIPSDNQTNKVQSTTKENKVQNGNQTNKIPSNNQTNKVQSTTQENKVQNANQTNKIPSDNQTNKVQSTTQENKVQNANQTNKVLNGNQTNKVQSNSQKSNVQTNNQTDKVINGNQTNIVQSKTQKNKVQSDKQSNKVLSDKTNIVLSNTQKIKVQSEKQSNKVNNNNQTNKVQTDNQINKVQSDNQTYEVQHENQMDQVQYENQTDKVQYETKDVVEHKTADEVHSENQMNEVQHDNTDEVQYEVQTNEILNENTGEVQDVILTNKVQDENTGEVEYENQENEVQYENRIDNTLNENQTNEGQIINQIINIESEKENMIDIKITENIEKDYSDETSNEKVHVRSEDASSKDEFRLTTFASGNLKTKIRMDANRLSPVVDMDESSDRDVSPIPTDSEGEKSRSPIKGKIETTEDIQKPLNDKREEMVNLIRESLSKDVVLDRLVGTLLGVLQGGGGTEAFLKGQGLDALFQAEETVNVKEVAMEDTGNGLVSALQIVKNINVNPKDALGETIIQYDTISHSADIVRDEIQIKKDEFQREARKVLAEGLVTSYPQAELVVSLIELKFTPEEAVQAAAECTSIQSAISFLHQECPLCANKCTIKQIVGMLECDHRCCKECAFNYFNLQITEGSVWDCVCPFCRLPDLKVSSQDQAQLYFSHLDILLKGILPEAIHELFQRKLRDWTLAQDPNFKWCTKCSSGFITVPNQKILMCPDCRSITCAQCRKPWEDSHEGRTCEEYGQQNEPENLLDKHLEEEGITCPACKARYSLARGGCMHMTCTSCKHEFCSGCSKPFLMGDRCQVSEYCGKLGLHAHHPRNCLFYLRDKEPQLLEQLLKENNINFDRDVPDQDQSGSCKVKLLKETDDGMIEGECSYPILAQALCRRHYVERLCRLVRKTSLETIELLGWEDMETLVRRHGLGLPPNPYGTPVEVYTETLRKIVQEEIPLE